MRASIIWLVCLVHFLVLGMTQGIAKQTEANIKSFITRSNR